MPPRPDRHPDRTHDHAPPPEHTTGINPPAAAPVVPIAVWRLDDSDDDQPTADPEAMFASRLARRLILVYTNRGDTVIDLDNNPHLHTATTATGRGYLALADTADIPALDDLHHTDQPISLITMQWPRTIRDEITPPTTAAVTDLLLACRLMTGDTAAIIAAVRPPAPTGTFAAHERTLRTAADTAGLAHALQITVVSSPGCGDAFLYYATATEAARATTSQPALHLDLLVFMPARTTAVPNHWHGSARSCLPNTRQAVADIQQDLRR